jgi:RNA polymerase sigma factor (sigma-70 family)
MADGQRGDVLRHVRKLLDAQKLEQLTDGQLLERYLSRQEEAAFAVLVRRHGPMVLGVCRRLLQDAHAAEDAFQATFLVLFRRARALDQRGSLANWLYTVAYHVALKARADAAHRRQRERQVGEMGQVESHPEEVWRDLQPVLDEELSFLPDKYRTPIVLCYLQGKTNEEAARQLGWPIGTVKGRLSRAREILRTRLARRGITLSTGLLGVVLAEHASAAVPGLLVHSTIQTIGLLSAGKAIAGSAAAPAAALAEGVLKAMFATKLQIATGLVLTVGVLGVGAGTLSSRLLAQRQAEESATGQPSLLPAKEKLSRQAAPAENKIAQAVAPEPAKPEDKNERSIIGRVLDWDGKPVADAQVVVVARRRRPIRGGDFSSDTRAEVLGQGKADADGHFRVAIRRISSAEVWQLHALAASTSHSLAMVQLGPDVEQPQTMIKLPREQSIRGRLLDLQGRPAAGVKVYVAALGQSEAGPKIWSWNPPERLPLWPKPVTADSQGRFVFQGLNGELGIQFEVRDDRFARHWFPCPRDNPDKEILVSLAPAQIIEGQILCEDTGKPAPHARLTVYATTVDGSQGENLSLGVGTGIDGTADADGRFRVNPFAGNFFTVTAYPPEGMPYLSRMQGLKWPKGSVKQSVEVMLPRRGAVLVRGKVMEAPSGKPVVGAGVQFIPRHANNPYLREDVVTGWQGMVTSGSDGTFQIPVLPGPGHLLVSGPNSDFIHQEITEGAIHLGRPGWRRLYPDGLVELDIAPETRTKEVTVTLQRGVTVRGRLIGPEGKPISQALMLCRLQVAPFDLNRCPSVEVRDGQFELHGCDADKTYAVYFLDPKNQWGVKAMISGGQAGEVVNVHLAPCGKAVARFVDPEGKPLKNYNPGLEILITPGADLFDETARKKNLLLSDTDFLANIDRLNYPRDAPRTDGQGRCTFPALIPGATYFLHSQKETAVERKEFTVEAGKTRELPDSTVRESP